MRGVEDPCSGFADPAAGKPGAERSDRRVTVYDVVMLLLHECPQLPHGFAVAARERGAGVVDLMDGAAERPEVCRNRALCLVCRNFNGVPCGGQFPQQRAKEIHRRADGRYIQNLHSVTGS